MVLYKGFSTKIRKTKFSLTDRELIKQDVINHFHIRKGEMIMQPTFGVIIWDLIFDPLTPDVKEAIVSDVRNVANNDPRVEFTDVIIQEFEHGIQVQIEMFFIQEDVSEILMFQFDRNNGLVAG